MESKFLIIAITSPRSVANESKKIIDILQNGEADWLHIRKPEWSLQETEELIQKIPDIFYHRIKIHDHFQLLEKYSLGGVHLNSRNPIPPAAARFVSRSLHDIEQLYLSKHYHYVTLSPIFDSISKIGYHSSFSLPQLKKYVEGKNVVALGGVTPDKFQTLKDNGFFGAAMLGYFWK